MKRLLIYLALLLLFVGCRSISDLQYDKYRKITGRYSKLDVEELLGPPVFREGKTCYYLEYTEEDAAETDPAVAFADYLIGKVRITYDAGNMVTVKEFIDNYGAVIHREDLTSGPQTEGSSPWTHQNR